LSGRQLAKFGVALGGTTGSMKAAGSTGRNSPERRRSAVTTWATFWLSSSTLPADPTNGGMAIGIGLIVPCVMSTRSCAEALPAMPTIETASARSSATRNRKAGLAKFIDTNS
jgi:hypothetical protein